MAECRTLTVPIWYGRQSEKTLEITSGTALWYRRGTPPRPIRWVLVRDPAGKRAPQAFFSTDTTLAPAEIIAIFVRRWQVEVTFSEVRAHLGVETQRQWSDNHHYRTSEGERCFARAAEIDPGYAQAHAWRAIMLGVMYLHDERAETLDAAFASAQEALRLDDNDAQCHHAMAYVALRRCEFELAGHHHARAAALNPNNPQTMAQRANWLMHMGRLDEALAVLDASLERDPFPPTWYWDVRGYVLYHLRRYREAVLAFRSVGAEPFWIAGMLAAAHAQAGETEAAAAELARYLAARPGVTLRTAADRIVYAEPGMREHWLEGLAKAGLPP
jgi:tetratricopeptide (TPR) repeat protein